MIDYVTVEIGSGGSTVMVEPELRKGLTRRVFRRHICWTAHASNGPPTMIGGRTTSEPAFGCASRDLPPR